MSGVILTFILACLAVAALGASSQRYPTKYDNANLQQILHNERLLQSYFKCLLGKGACTPEGEELKRNIPDALETDCSKCSDKQKEGTEIVMKFLIEKKPEMYKVFEAHFDPTGKYRKKYEKTAASHGIKV